MAKSDVDPGAGDADVDRETSKLFIFGLCILFAWMIVIIICASPKLFRDVICHYCFCWFERRREARKVEEAKAKVRSMSQSFLVNSIAVQPSNIILHQAFGTDFDPLNELVEEESRFGESQKFVASSSSD